MQTIHTMWTACLFLLLCSCARAQNDFTAQRRLMVKEQIQARGVSDSAVLAAMQKVPRHVFVPPRLRSGAYEDHPLPIGHGQTISQPYIVALMTGALDLTRNKKVLEIGTGSGYQAAILATLCDTVFSMEIIKPLGKRAADTLAAHGFSNVRVRIGDGYKGWAEHAPYDAIIVTCAPTHIPEPLKKQLAEGGIMVIPVGERGHQELLLLEKRNGRITKKAIIPVRFVPMTKKDGGNY
ncbi:MAG: protein-L-isoaspartate(D-aspartate) O-methyltransferase [Chitinispirillaceae bacterium]|nr:protein-L-isoaspartate(D-aspartate) O-methyltransferase [Chitinispirillaceae bacterium]